MFISFMVGGCVPLNYDHVTTSSIPSRFYDSKPQYFGKKNPDLNPIHGIDVSKWDGNIKWEKTKKSGVSFVFIKATEGKDFLDNSFSKNWQNAHISGIPHAPYHFYHFCSSADEQADWFIRNVPRESVYLPPVIDVEWNPMSKTCPYRPDPQIIRQEMKRFMNRIQGYYKKRPIIYTSVDFYREVLSNHFHDYPFWVRSVAAHPDITYSNRKWLFWQYTSTGVVPGIDTKKTDINVFSGSLNKWYDWLSEMNINYYS